MNTPSVYYDARQTFFDSPNTMTQSHLPPPVLNSYNLGHEPVKMPNEEPVQRTPVDEPIQMPVDESVRQIPVEQPVRTPVEQPVKMPVEEPARQRPVEEPPKMPVEEPVRQMPNEEPAPLKQEQFVRRRNNQIMQHPSGSEGWLPTEDVVPQQMPEPRHKRAASISSARIKDNDNLDATIAANAETASVTPRRAVSIGRAGSRRIGATADTRPVPGSAFEGGAGATGPKATAEEDLAMTARSQEAQANLSRKQKSKIEKIEAKNDKRLSKIIRNEGKAEKAALAIAINELNSLQKVQKNTIKNEGEIQHNLSRLNVALKRAETEYLNAKRKLETAQAAVDAEVGNLEAVRQSARDETEHMQKKTAEVNALRSTLAVDEREREVKLTQLKGPAGR